MSKSIPFTTTRGARQAARWVCSRARRKISARKRAARRNERRSRKQHDNCGDTDWSPRKRGLTGWEII
jgi:hypothetical protein